MAKTELEKIKVLKAKTEEAIQTVKATKADATIIKIKDVDYLLLECPKCKLLIAIPMVTIRLLKHKQKYAGVV